MVQAAGVKSLVRRLAGRGFRFLFPRKDYVSYRGSRLPRPESRLNREDQQDNEFFLNSSIGEAQRVMARLGCTPGSSLLEIGCGQGRLAIGLVREFENLRYLGLDVSESCIRWCRNNIQSQYPSYRFQHIDLVNARYNPGGVALTGDFRLPMADGEADVVYLWGVVTNMEPEHLETYVREMARVLRAGGRLFLTANIEVGVPTVSINPENYTAFACDGPLHIVRYEHGYFTDVFRTAGLEMTDFLYHGAGNCQSDMYFEKRTPGEAISRDISPRTDPSSRRA